jgi:hypothetical protein
MKKKKKRPTAAKNNRSLRGRRFSIIELSVPCEIGTFVDPSGLYVIQKAIRTRQNAISSIPAEPESKPSDSVLNSLRDIALHAWRAEIRMIDRQTRTPLEEMRRVYRHIEALIDTLKELDIKIIDPQGRKYDSGMALKVIGFEDRTDLDSETIIETVRPSISWRNQFLLQMGEVIVGRPAEQSLNQGEVTHE